jgi:hypothetical protein
MNAHTAIKTNKQTKQTKQTNHSSRRKSSGIGKSFFKGSGAFPRPARYCRI